MDITQSDARAKRNVAVLVAAMAILGSQITMMFVVGGLAGLQLAPNPCLATLPITMIVLGSATSATWLSAIMQRYGRVTGFLTGATGALIGSILGIGAVVYESFALLLVAAYFTGIYQSSQGFFRFAAADTASDAFKPKAISYVMAGGLAAAIIGPQIVGFTVGNSPVASVDRFVPVYVAALIINVAGMGLFFLLDIPRPPRPSSDAVAPRTRLELLRSPVIGVSVLCAAVGFGLMNLMMTATPLAVVGCGFGVADASNVVSAHVLAMYAPAFFTGHLIARLGERAVISAGLLCLVAASIVGLSGVTLTQFFGALVLLGLGWNFTLIGSTSLLGTGHSPEEKGRVQGLNDTIVMGCVTMASIGAGGILNCAGGDPETGWTAISMTMLPFLVLAGAALIWLSLRPRVAA